MPSVSRVPTTWRHLWLCDAISPKSPRSGWRRAIRTSRARPRSRLKTFQTVDSIFCTSPDVIGLPGSHLGARPPSEACSDVSTRSEEHTSELQSLMRISYAVFCLKKKKNQSCINNTFFQNFIHVPQPQNNTLRYTTEINL